MVDRSQFKEETITLDDDLWEEFIEFTDGAATLCYQCGVCTANCPWGVVKEDSPSVREFIRRAQLGIYDKNGDRQKEIWLCTTCAQCEAYCPRGVEISEIIRGLRYLTWKWNKPEFGLPSMLWSVYWNNNPWEQPPSQRNQWAKNLSIPSFNPEKHEILLYIGCTPSFDPRANKIAVSLAKVLNAAGVSYGTLGEDEPCCGESVLSVGHKPFFEEVASTTLRKFEKHGISKLITISPHCYDVIKNHYPRVAQEYGLKKPLVQHYTQYLEFLINVNRIPLSNSFLSKVTFQDPCYLSRHNQETEAPRQVLKHIPGVEFIEMKDTRINGLCCGGGGGRMWLETDAGERFSDLRVKQAINTGAETLATACPFCVTCLEDSIKGLGYKHLDVLDIAEIVAKTI